MTLQDTLNNPSIQVAFIVEIEYRNPTTDTISTVRYQTPNRTVDDGYPSLLLDPGDISYSVELDSLNAANGSGISTTIIKPCTLDNTPHTLGDDGPLSYLRSMSLSGRSIILYAGAADDIFSAYEILSESTMYGEPVFDDGSNTVEIARESPLDRFRADIDIPSYVGEPGALRIIGNTRNAGIPYNIAHDLVEFTLAGRFYMESLTGTGEAFRLALKTNSAGRNNWYVRVNDNNNTLQASFQDSAGATPFTLDSGTLVSGRYYTWVWSYRAGNSYLMVDGVVTEESTSTTIPATGSGGSHIAFQTRNSQVMRGLDYRIYNKYIPPNEMRSAMLTRAAGNEEGLVGLWRGDDYTGSSLTDYSSTGADATITGTEGVDFDWVTSGLGGEQLAGQSMPCVIGSVYHWPADLVDSVLEVWRVFDSIFQHSNFYSSSTNRSVFDQGEELSSGVDYDWINIGTNEDALVYLLAGEAGEPLTARYGILHSTGAIGLPYDVFGPSLVSTRKTLLIDYGPLSASEVNSIPISSALPCSMGIFTKRQPLLSVLSETVRGMCGYVVSDRDNTVRLDTVLPPVSPSPRGGKCLEIISTDTNTFDPSSNIEWSGTNLTSRDFTMGVWIKSLRTSPNDLGINTLTGGINLMSLIGQFVSGAMSIHWYISVESGTTFMELRARPFSGSTVKSNVGFGDILSDPWAWWFVAVSHDDTNNITKFYAAKEGDTLQLIGSGSDLSLASTPTDTDLKVGGADFINFFRGSVLEPQIWNGVRTLAQLQTSMDSALVGNETNLIFYAPCNTLDSANLTDTVTSNIGVVSGQVHQRPNLVLDLTQTPYRMNRRNLIPAKSIEVRYRRNYAPLSPSDIAATVTQEESLSLQKEYLSVLWEDDEIAEDYKNARDIVIDSPFYGVNGANALVRLLRYRYRPGSEIAEIFNIQRVSMLLKSGDEMQVIGHESDIEDGLTYRVIGNHIATLDKTSNVVLVR